ncbi:MAG: hypothetical protein WAT39_09200 [Planctomycetota bacterium]
MTERNDGKNDHAGMTVNERLHTAGLLAAFDAAAKARDRARMLAILTQVAVPSPERTVAAILADPQRYGY